MKNIDSSKVVAVILKTCLACLACVAWWTDVQASTFISISRAQWEAAGATTVAEALARVGRIHVTNAGGPGQRSVAWVNGATPADVLITVNGLVISEANRRSMDLSQWYVDGFSSIDVTEGPSIDVPGNGARRIGINLVTRKEEVLTGGWRGGGGAASTVDGAGQIFFPFGLGVSAGYGQTEGVRSSQRWVGRHGMASWQHTVSDTFSFWAAGMGYSDGMNMATPSFGTVDGARERLAMMAMGRWEISEASSLRLGTTAVYASRRYNSTSGVSTSGPFRQGSVHWAYGTRINEADIVTVQGSYTDAQTDEGLMQGSHWSWGDFMIQNKLDFNNILVFLAELRVDQHSLFGPFMSPTLEFIVNLQSSRVVVSMANTVTFPTMDEVGMAPISLSGTTWSGNGTLQPERSWVYRLSAEQNMNGFKFGVDFSGGGGESLIDHNWLLSGGVRTPTNVATARMVGLGVNVGIQVTEGMDYWAGYQFREWRSGNTVLTDRPRQTLTQSLMWTTSFGWVITGWVSYAQLPIAGITPYPFVESDGAAAASLSNGVAASWKASEFFKVRMAVDNLGSAGRFGLEGYEVAPNHFSGSISMSW